MAIKFEYSALWTDESTIAHSIFRRDGRHQESGTYSLELWSECLAILGELGWEAISIQEVHDTNTTTWWFKRAINPSNDNLKIGGGYFS